MAWIYHITRKYFGFVLSVGLEVCVIMDGAAKRLIIYLNECSRALHKGERGYLGDHIPAGIST